MNKYLSVFVGSLVLVLSQKVLSTELMLLTSEPRVKVLNTPASQGKVPAKFRVSQSESAQIQAVARTEAVSERLVNYPQGTVVLVFWDASNSLKGILPLLAQSERMGRRLATDRAPAFEPSIQIIEFPEDIAARFYKTDVWQKSSARDVEYLASVSGPE